MRGECEARVKDMVRISALLALGGQTLSSEFGVYPTSGNSSLLES